MTARRATITQDEIKRTLKAAIAAGLRVGEFAVDHRTGKVTIVAEGAGETDAEASLLAWQRGRHGKGHD